MDRIRLGWLLVAVGAALVALSALADPLGLGEGGAIGYKQIIGMVVGGALLVAGLAVVVTARRNARSQQVEL